MTLYHYDAGGNFTGSSGGTPPGCGCGAWGCLALVIVAGLVICKVGSVLLEELPPWMLSGWVPAAFSVLLTLISFVGLPAGLLTWMTVSAGAGARRWMIVPWCVWGIIWLLLALVMCKEAMSG